MLEIKNLNFAYSRKKVIMDNLTLSLGKGTVCGLLGKNGTGKSTLIYLLCGLLKPKSGTISVNGFNPFSRNINFLNDIFLVPEEFSLPSISIKKYVSVNAPLYPNFSMEQFRKYLEMFEMDENAHLGQISMGQKKKAFIAFAMACETSVLILDEPTNGLDISAKRSFRKAIAECMNDDKLILISTHQVYDIDKILDHVVIIDQKNLLLNKPLFEISKEYQFNFTTDKERAANAILSLDVPGGYNIVEFLKDADNETEVNIETLFELVTGRNFQSDSNK